MWAGAANCDLDNGWPVGTATVTVTANGYVLDLVLNEDCTEDDLHVWVSNSPPPDPNKGFKGYY